MKPDYADAYNGLANIYNAQRKFDQAAEASAKARELSAACAGSTPGGNADALFNQGVILWNGGKIADAKAKFEAAIAAKPEPRRGALSARHGARERRQAGGSRRRVQHLPEALARRRPTRRRQGSRRATTEVVLDPAALRARLADVRDRIARAAGRAGRDPSRIRLVAVSKTFGADAVRVGGRRGQIDFGENKVQEAQQEAAGPADLPLAGTSSDIFSRTRQERPPPSSTSFIRSTASRCSRRIDEAAAALGRRVELLVQVDLAGEPTKHGAREEELLAIFDAAGEPRRQPGCGLMLLPPAVDDPEPPP